MGNIVKEVAESPARVVEKTIETTTTIAKEIPIKKPVRVARKYWGTLGPGLTTGASGDDPAGIASYSQIGAKFGFQYLWLALVCIPPMIVIQEMCARIAQVTGRGMAGVIKQSYPKSILYVTIFTLFAANTISIGADIAGMVAATQLLMPALPYGFLAIGFTVLSLILQIGLPYSRYANFLKYLTLVLFAYIATAFFISFEWDKVAIGTFIPKITWTKDSIVMVTAALGATLSPYLLFWQASQEIEQQKEEHNRTTLSELRGTNKKEITAMRNDVASGMIFSNIIMYFIILVTGATLFSKGLTIATAADAANALRPFAGDYATLLFAVGIIGTGLLTIPILAGSSSFAIAEAFSMKEGLDKKLRQAYGFYGVIIIAMLIGLAINFLGIDPIQALIGASVINGLVTPILVTVILLVGNNAKIMGEWKNGPWSRTLGWLIAGVMYLAGGATIWSLVS